MKHEPAPPPDDPRERADETAVSETASRAVERCYRHPQVRTGVHCTRCGRPICPDCMVEAPVGHQCPECVERARREFRLGPQRRALAIASTPVTKVLLYAIGIGFVVEVVRGQAGAVMAGPPIGTLVDLGASVPLIVDPSGSRAVGGIAAGEYWRLLSAVFLHGGLWHVAINAFFLWNLGQFVERTFGRWRTLLLFLLTGFLASVTSYAFGPVDLAARVPGSGNIVVGTVAVGASGAVFGFFGAYVAFNARRRHLATAAANLRWAFLMIGLNVVFGLAVPGIDNRAHLGGLVAGFLAGWLLEGFGPRRFRPIVTWVGIAGLLALGVVLTVSHTATLQATYADLF